MGKSFMLFGADFGGIFREEMLFEGMRALACKSAHVVPPNSP